RPFRWNILWPASFLAAAAVFGAFFLPIRPQQPQPVLITAEHKADGTNPLTANRSAERPDTGHSNENDVPAVRLVNFSKAELLRDMIPELGAPLQLNHEYTLAKGMLELHF